MRTPFRDAACKLAVLKPAVADGAKIIQREGDAPDLLAFFSYPPEFKLEARGVAAGHAGVSSRTRAMVDSRIP